jgi:ATP-dependent RNA helicase DeaD
LFNIIENIEAIDVQSEEIKEYLPIILKRLEGLSREDLVSRLLSVEFNQFLEYYKNAPDLNIDESGSGHEERRKGRKEESGRGNRRHNYHGGESGYTRLFFNTGRLERVEPPHIIQLINKGAGKHGVGVGRIDIYDGFTYVDVDARHADDILESLNGLNFRGRTLRVDVATPRGGDEPHEKKRVTAKKKKPFNKKKRGFEGKAKKKRW